MCPDLLQGGPLGLGREFADAQGSQGALDQLFFRRVGTQEGVGKVEFVGFAVHQIFVDELRRRAKLAALHLGDAGLNLALDGGGEAVLGEPGLLAEVSQRGANACEESGHEADGMLREELVQLAASRTGLLGAL